MESNWLTKNKRTLALVIILTLAAWMLYNVRRDLMSTLSPFIYAAVFAYLLNPLINLLERRGIKRFWSSLRGTVTRRAPSRRRRRISPASSISCSCVHSWAVR